MPSIPFHRSRWRPGGGGKRVTISFSYLTLDFLLLTQIKLLGRSGRGRKATRSRKRLCALHSCWRTTRKLIMTSSSYHANIRVTSTKLRCPRGPRQTAEKNSRYSFDHRFIRLRNRDWKRDHVHVHSVL